jgi:hypothetical protein
MRPPALLPVSAASPIVEQLSDQETELPTDILRANMAYGGPLQDSGHPWNGAEDKLLSDGLTAIQTYIVTRVSWMSGEFASLAEIDDQMDAFAFCIHDLAQDTQAMEVLNSEVFWRVKSPMIFAWAATHLGRMATKMQRLAEEADVAAKLHSRAAAALAQAGFTEEEVKLLFATPE